MFSENRFRKSNQWYVVEINHYFKEEEDYILQNLKYVLYFDNFLAVKVFNMMYVLSMY